MAEAYVGEPYGVGRILFEGGRVADAPGTLDRTTLTERSGRLFFPVHVSQPVRQLLRSLISAPQRSIVYFLFVGSEPLDLTVYAPGATSRTLRPIRNERMREELLSTWWSERLRSNSEWGPSDARNTLAETYLSMTLARRLRLEPPGDASDRMDAGRGAVELLLGTDRLRSSMAREMLRGASRPQIADQTLPEPLAEPPRDTADPPADVAIEPIAAHVPAECFYIRFGSFPNYLWFRHRLDAWGGDVRNLVSERSLDYGLHKRLERQLALHETVLARLLGERVISDVAVVGTDSFMREGAAMGVLFQASNSASLHADITRQRLEALEHEPGAKEQKLKLAEREVSFISTTDNRLRSFYAVSGDYHFVTTSRALARRFLEASGGVQPLAQSKEFRIARSRVPLDRKDSTFIYLSPAFLRNLAGPQYRVESLRRVRSAVEIETVLLARLLARAERRPADSLDDLVRGGLLPKGFAERWDGSRLVFERGEVYDSLRGTRGTFVPVPDVELGGVTKQEAREYERFFEYFETEMRSFDPVTIALHRTRIDGSLERVAVDVQAALGRRNYERLARWVGPASDQRLARLKGELVNGQVSISEDNPLGGGAHTLFIGLRNAEAQLESGPGGLLGFLAPRSVHGYVGAYPGPGMLSLIGGGRNVQLDSGGFAQLLSGVWRRDYERFTLLSFRPAILEEVAPQLHFEKVDHPAQVWLHSEDLVGTGVGQTINEWGYRYARGVAQSNIRFMNALAEQYHVPRANCKEISELLLDARLVSPIGGKFELRNSEGGLPSWVVVRPRPKDASSTDAAAGYQFPAVTWLRGLELEARLDETALTAHAEAVMPAEAVSSVTLPELPSFSLPGLFSGQKPKGAAEEKSTTPKAGPKPEPRKDSARPAEPAPRDAHKSKPAPLELPAPEGE